jgi:hypothetical protein
VGEVAGEAPEIVDWKIGNPPLGIPAEAIALPQNGAGTARDRRCYEFAPVASRTGISDEYLSGCEAAAVGGEAGHAYSLRGEQSQNMFGKVLHT